MSRWDKQFKRHPIHATLAELRELCDLAPENPDDQNIIERRRLAKVINAFTEVLDSIDPELVPFNQLDALNTQLRHANIWNHVNNYKANLNTQHLVAINDQISVPLSQLASVVGVAKLIGSVGPEKEIEHLFDEFVAAVAERQKEINKGYAALSETVKQGTQSVEELHRLIEKRREEVNAQISAWQQQFSEAQDRRSTEYNEWRNKVENETREVVDQAISENNEKFVQESEMFREKMNALLDDSRKKHEEILSLYELTAGDSVGAGYLKNAEDEKKAGESLAVDFYRIYLTNKCVATVRVDLCSVCWSYKYRLATDCYERDTDRCIVVRSGVLVSTIYKTSE